MKFKIREIFVRSITVELENNEKYEIEGEAKYYINGEELLSSNLNVNTIDGLIPDTEYTLRVETPDKESMEESFKTKHESVCLSVLKFGAKGDGESNDTFAIQAAISSCPKDGTVYFPKGDYYTGPLFLKNNINIWIPEGARLLGDTERSHYPVLPGMTLCTDESDEYNLGTWEGNPMDNFASLITGIEVKNVDIFGKGEINGNADKADWWRNPKIKRKAWRPRTVFFERSKNIRMQDLLVGNSPSWTIHPYYSDDLKFLSLRIRNPKESPNTDGLDPESCSKVLVLGTDISVGDDCIAIKAGKYYMALKHHKKTEDVTVRNCLLRYGHGSVTIGSECAGGVKDVNISKCIFDSTDRGLRIKSRRGRGNRSIIENISFENILMKDVKMPFTINMFYFCDPDGHSVYCQSRQPLKVDELTPEVRSVKAKNIVCSGADVSILCAYGLPEKKIGLLEFTDIDASFKPEITRTPGVPVMMDGLNPMSGKGVFVRNVSKLVLKNVNIHGSSDTEIDEEDVESKDCKKVCFLED
ncbi:MAG: glycoside hydrolase family 28 protein [Lachnospiraceae bacterium]|nr:glycoside hydrolase family 28 protein [Lachnospiraceae bacterium]